MDNYQRMSQTTGSQDCGFFCGWVIHLANLAPYVDGAWCFSREAVYSTRDSFLSRRSTGRSAQTRLTDCQAPRWLGTFPSCSGYSMVATGHGTFAQGLQALLGTGKGVMLLLHSAGAGLSERNNTGGHWVAVMPHRNRARCFYYDPIRGATRGELPLSTVTGGLDGQVTSTIGPPGTNLHGVAC
ncbi:MAG: hypothetical protein HQ581_17225 [Planctomycetes bacterium]|nr:hypothetical protein [Planctomycetota bacterium]